MFQWKKEGWYYRSSWPHFSWEMEMVISHKTSVCVIFNLFILVFLFPLDWLCFSIFSLNTDDTTIVVSNVWVITDLQVSGFECSAMRTEFHRWWRLQKSSMGSVLLVRYHCTSWHSRKYALRTICYKMYSFIFLFNVSFNYESVHSRWHIIF